MRLVNLNKLAFEGDKMVSIPLNKVSAEDVQDRSQDFSKVKFK